MNSVARSSFLGATLGAGLMALFDPARGNRRRALIRDKMAFAARKTRDAAGATRRDVGNRLYGIRARLRSRFSGEHPGDHVLCERVRAELGRVASHPRAICVTSENRSVTLTGDVLAFEVVSIVNAVKGVHGVDTVRNQMTPHVSSASIPSLQGESPRPGHWRVWLREGWSPTAILTTALASAAGLAVVGRAAAGRRPGTPA